jgi:hypothetical protein
MHAYVIIVDLINDYLWDFFCFFSLFFCYKGMTLQITLSVWKILHQALAVFIYANSHSTMS